MSKRRPQIDPFLTAMDQSAYIMETLVIQLLLEVIAGTLLAPLTIVRREAPALGGIPPGGSGREHRGASGRVH
jgi:hypothetical protein